MIYEIPFLEGECFWGGITMNGNENPFTAESTYSVDMRVCCVNQTMPLYLSNKGRYIWSENPFNIVIEDGKITLEGEDVLVVEAGSTLREAYLAAMKAHFPFDGRHLPEEFFQTAQYNTWMEFVYDPTQEGVLDYAKGIIENGFEPGILIIDEGWHERYGIWEFDPYKFPDPKAMMDELHAMGFKVLLWVTPFVTPDGVHFARHYQPYLPDAHKDADKLFVRDAEGKLCLFEWWNGFSGLLDLRKPWDCEYLKTRLDRLMKDYGIDGFKFDGGHVYHYAHTNIINKNLREDHDPHAMNIAWNEFGRQYDYHEFKDTYKGGGKNGIQRLCDRGHSWVNDGIDTLIPSSIVQGLVGHPFICPDMIGGGSWSVNYIPGFKVDEELFIRMAQSSCLCPMMQFSWAPWRVLSEKALRIVQEAAQLHKRLAPEIQAMVNESEKSGEPILRCLEYNDPGKGYEKIMDEFMLGEDILVAPVITEKNYSRDVVFPAGVWVDEEGNSFEGNRTYHLDAPIEKLLWFRRK